MKATLIHFSPGGTTAKTLRNIAKGFPEIVEVAEINMIKPENRKKKYDFSSEDLVLIGFPTATSLLGLPEEVFSSIKGDGTPFVGCVTCGNGYYGKGLIVLKKEMEKIGFKMIAAGGFVGQYSFDNNLGKGRPDAKDEAIQKGFGKKIYEKVFEKKDYSFSTKLKVDWPSEGGFSTAKCALISASPVVGCRLPKSMNEFKWHEDKCVKCNKCIKACPVEAVSWKDDKITFDRDKCIGCQGCYSACPSQSIEQVNKTIIKMVNNVKKHRSERKEPDLFL